MNAMSVVALHLNRRSGPRPSAQGQRARGDDHRASAVHWTAVRCFALCLILGSFFPGLQAAETPSTAPTTASPAATNALTLHEVLDSVRQQYPPMLAALIERDVAAGRLQSARGTFDFQFFSRLFDAPSGYYQSTTVDTGFEQFTGLWGSALFGGYRVTTGGLLPDYEKSRTQGSGEPRIGFRLPLLRDGSIDRRRATLIKARLDKDLADPVIHRQQIDFIRAATAGYYGWLAAGERLRLSEALLRVARERMDTLKTQSLTIPVTPSLKTRVCQLYADVPF